MKKEMNNKGFSLVELIIVIAIMAILIVVLAPQYLKYVERSRNSTDLQNVTELKNAVEIYAADPESPQAVNAAFTITVTRNNVSCGDAAVWAALTDAGLVNGTSPSTDIKCSSRNAWDTYTMTGTPQTNGSITWAYTSTVGGGSDNGNLANKMKGNS